MGRRMDEQIRRYSAWRDAGYDTDMIDEDDLEDYPEDVVALLAKLGFRYADTGGGIHAWMKVYPRRNRAIMIGGAAVLVGFDNEELLYGVYDRHFGKVFYISTIRFIGERNTDVFDHLDMIRELDSSYRSSLR